MLPTPSRDGDHGWPSRAGADSRLSLLRELGEQAVLETIFRRGPITRPEIAAATNLSKPTVSAAVSRLQPGGLVRAAGPRAGQRGRKPVSYVASSRAGLVVGGGRGGSDLRLRARGGHGAAGEIGYLPLVSDPFNPRHRLHGGLEDEIGAAGIVAAFNERRGAGDPELSSVHDVFELAGTGNEAARAVVEHVASRLG